MKSRAVVLAAVLSLAASAAPADDLDRPSLRARQSVLSPGESREGERRLDAIERKQSLDPDAARDLRRIYRADESRATVNRPIPGGEPTPGLVGPGEHRD
ncbi:MAG: hypothetical protein HY985_11135 [Magnetospirillum sp.]|nr:hypothetical protein [Magnetospirillum sp.]